VTQRVARVCQQQVILVTRVMLASARISNCLRLSVCLSVCLSQVGVSLKWLNVG